MSPPPLSHEAAPFTCLERTFRSRTGAPTHPPPTLYATPTRPVPVGLHCFLALPRPKIALSSEQDSKRETQNAQKENAREKSDDFAKRLAEMKERVARRPKLFQQVPTRALAHSRLPQKCLFVRDPLHVPLCTWPLLLPSLPAGRIRRRGGARKGGRSQPI